MDRNRGKFETWKWKFARRTEKWYCAVQVCDMHVVNYIVVIQ